MKNFLLLFCLSFILNSYSQQTITHETLWMLKRVGAPEISPDGRWVVYSVNEPSYDEKETVNDLWIVAADGSTRPRRLTSTKAGESGYQWSPDGRVLAFTAKRDGDEASQVYLLNMAEGGEAQRLTRLSTGAASPKWSPDGQSILFTSKVYPGKFSDAANKKEAEERKKIKYKARIYESFPIRSWDQWVDEKQVHLFIQELDSDSAMNLFRNFTPLQQEGFRFGGQFTFTPDGKGVVISATEEYHRTAYDYVNYNLYRISLTDSSYKKLTGDNNQYAQPQFSPDGKYLVCKTSASKNNKLYNISRLVRFDWPSMGNRVVLAEKLDRPVNDWTFKDQTILASIEDESRDKIFSISILDGKAELFSTVNTGCINNLSISRNGRLVASYESTVQPAEIVMIGDKGEQAFLSEHNREALSRLDLQPLETFWHQGKNGKRIHSLMVKPPGFDATKKYPLFVLIHGGPAVSFKDNFGYRWNPHLLGAPGYVVLMTNYTGSPGYGEKFAQDIQFDPFKGPAAEINEAAAAAIKKYSFIDGSRQAAGGASYGGHLSNWLQGTTNHYKCLVSHAGLVNSEAQWGTSDAIFHREIMAGGPPWKQTRTWKDQNPIRLAENFKTPVLVTVGEKDFRVPLNNTLEYWSALQRMKVPSRLIVFPDENHWILNGENSRFFYSELHRWLSKYLK